MARRFVRIDLSDTGRDFRPVAVEPGVPLLDKSNGNAKILFKWLGGLVAEPEWEGESVSFYAREDHGGRLEDITCQMVSEADLKGPLKDDVEAIKQRIAKAKPETSTERAVQKIVNASFIDLVENPNRTDRDNYFFRYRDVQGRWRLVWCWGYQRVDMQPAALVVCTDPECNLLFVRRPGESYKCPSCEANLAARPVERRSRKRGLLVGLLLFLFGALLVYWLLNRNQLVAVPDRLVVSPEQLDMIVGEIADLGILSPSSDPIEVTSSSPAVVEVTKANRLIGRSQGAAKIEVKQGTEARSVDVTVTPGVIQSIAVKPMRVVVPVAESRAVRVMARTEGDRQIELAPDMVKCEKKPSPSYADVDPASLEIRGVRPTAPGKPEQLAVSFQKLRAEAPVEVVGTAAGPGLVIAEHKDRPVEVRILSDQGQSVRFPVGSQFDDFRVEAQYKDGVTRIVTKKATLSTPESAQKPPVSFAGGRMVGVRPGRTAVQAEFDGVRAKTGLEAEVLAQIDVDEIRLAPAPVKILPGETLGLEATGYKGGKSVGLLSGLGSLQWKSDNQSVVRVEGPLVTGAKLGKGNVTAQLGSVASKPAEVSVVRSVEDALVLQGTDGKKLDVLQMYVGENLRLGADFSVFRGNADFSPHVEVQPAMSGIVRYDARTRSLHGVAPGESPVTFAWGDKVTSAVVQVLPAGSLQGQVVVEPATGVFSAGQALDLRVFLVTKEGDRMDRTDSATLTSSAPETIAIQGSRACAMAPGSAEITAKLPGVESAGKAALTVDNEPIADLIVDPGQMHLSVGDVEGLRISGRSASGTRELFPQPNLKLSVAGQDPQAVRIVGSKAVEGLAAGSADVKVNWMANLSQQVPVTVSKDQLTDLRITPTEASVHLRQGIVYQVTGMRGGERRVLGPEDGAKLSSADTNVAEVVGYMGVEGTNLGQTQIIAQVGDQQAKATLNVVPGTAAPVIVSDAPQGVVVTGPGGGWFGADGVYHVWVDGDRILGGRTIIGPGGTEIYEGPAAVRATDTVWVEPKRASVKLGETTPRFTVMVQGADGAQRALSAPPESVDPAILAPDSEEAGRFVARSLGRTQVRARYGDRDVFADVTVTGERFAAINADISDPTAKDFAVAADIVAADPDTPLEYRVYIAGEAPPANWVPSRQEGGSRRVALQSPRITTGPLSAFYNLVFEARDPSDGSIQKYPYTFRLKPGKIEEVKDVSPDQTPKPGAPRGKPADSAEPAQPDEKPAKPSAKGENPFDEAATAPEKPAKPAQKPAPKPAAEPDDDPFSSNDRGLRIPDPRRASPVSIPENRRSA